MKLSTIILIFFGCLNAFAQNNQESPLISDVLKKSDVRLVFLKPLKVLGTTGEMKENFRLEVYKNTPLTCTAAYRTSISSPDMLNIEPGYDAFNKIDDYVPLWMDPEFGSKDFTESDDTGTKEKIHLVISGPYAILWVDCDEFSAKWTSPFETVDDFEKATDGVLTLR